MATPRTLPSVRRGVGSASSWMRPSSADATRRGELAEEDARAAGLARMAGDLGHLSAFALPIIDLLDALPREASWSVWLEHLRQLTSAAIRQPAGVLAVLAELEH